MPSHKIHIGIGQEINKEYKYDSDLFLLGSILPDLGKEHFISHFKINHRKYNIEDFVNKYYDKNDPVMVGYLVHLLTDSFYNKYVRENKYIYDKNNKLCGIKLVDCNFYGDPDEVCDKKQEGFYDYEHYLLNNKSIIKLNEVDLDKLTDIKECGYDKNYISEYIYEHNRLIKVNDFEIIYDIFTFDELDNLYKNCINYIKDYLHNLNNSLENRK